MAYGLSIYVSDVFASCGSHVLAGAACCVALLWEVAAGAVVEALGMRISLSPH